MKAKRETDENKSEWKNLTYRHIYGYNIRIDISVAMPKITYTNVCLLMMSYLRWFHWIASSDFIIMYVYILKAMIMILHGS